MRLGEEVQLLGEDRQLAGLGALQLAFDADQIAQVEALGHGPVLIADLVAADEHLDLAGPIANIEEDQLASLALQHDPAGRADLGAMRCSACRPLRPAASVTISPSRRESSQSTGGRRSGCPQGSTPSSWSLAQLSRRAAS